MKKISFIVLAALAFAACKTSKHTTTSTMPTVKLDTVYKVADAPHPPIYRGSAKMASKLMHTKLEVKFDYAKAFLYGKATITAQPYFYADSTFILDAKGFDIHEVDLVKGNTKSKLNYTYDDTTLSIQLDRIYTRNDSFTVFVDYTAKPNMLKAGGSAAITDDKGLYFINPDGKEKNKPQQIWTQGETQSNCCWFPTIDRPNQRQTCEIYMTVDKKYVTLSNGAMVSQKENGDGTRTDHWEMNLPFAPYLTMMAVGDFVITKDHWKDRPVDYYLEPKYAPYARDIFGDTPAMIDYFSNTLKFPYAWNKYDQIVVRDYVSGAMENVTATLHGDFVQRTKRELLDNKMGNEDIISHELFHHWFGDLVTCESWSNIPLNESFATYGEYMWREHRFGRDAADELMQENLRNYLAGAADQHVDLIRFHYNSREDMFDLNSYQKGGCVLHMLRNVVGDDAFFSALHLYLEKNKFSSVEIHNLRLAFEKVTGTDMNWFFNEWFLATGNMELKIQSTYNDTTKKEMVSISQTQDFKYAPLYTMPIDVDIYFNGKKERHKITISKVDQTFSFDVPVKPDLVNVDAQKMLLCTKSENKSMDEWAFQYKHAPLYLDRYESLDKLSESINMDPTAKSTMLSALNDPYFSLRVFAIEKLHNDTDITFEQKLIEMAKNDAESTVRSHALKSLSANFKGADLMALYQNALNDSSYMVESTALLAIAKTDPKQAVALAKKYENNPFGDMDAAIEHLYGTDGTEADNAFFLEAANRSSGFTNIGLAINYTDFLKNCSDTTIDKGLPVLETIAKDPMSKWIRYYGKKGLNSLMDMYSDREDKATEQLKTNPSDTKSQSDLSEIKNQKEKIKTILSGLGADE
ncbi:MAG: M1 family aminopeptidase [Bacteroidia bacterium]